LVGGFDVGGLELFSVFSYVPVEGIHGNQLVPSDLFVASGI
jgi:hypothetical protein